MGNELERSKTWFNRSKTYRAKSLEILKQLYSAGIHATLETQPETSWEQPAADKNMKPGSEPKGIDHESMAKPVAKKKRSKRKQAKQSAEGSNEPH